MSEVKPRSSSTSSYSCPSVASLPGESCSGAGMDIALDSDDASSPVKKDVRQETDGMTNGGGATNGNVFDIAMEEMNQEEEENDEEDEAGTKEDDAKEEEDADGAKEEDAGETKEEDAEGAKENGDDESKTDEGGEKSSPSSLKTKGAMKEVVRKDFFFFTVGTFLHKLSSKSFVKGSSKFLRQNSNFVVKLSI